MNFADPRIVSRINESCYTSIMHVIYIHLVYVNMNAQAQIVRIGVCLSFVVSKAVISREYA